MRYKADDLRPRLRDPQAPQMAASILASLGGAANVEQAEAAAQTRLRVTLVDASKLDEAALQDAGVQGVMQLPGGVLHLLLGLNADQYAVEMRAAMAG